MNKSFYRKVAFGLGVEEKIPDNPVDWAIEQIETLPELNWKGPIYTLKEMMNYHASYNYTDRRVLRKKHKNSRQDYKDAKNKLKYATGHYYFEPLWLYKRHHEAVNGSSPVFHRFLHFWGNHFAIQKKNAMYVYDVGPYHFEVIAPAMLKNIEDLVYDVTISWAMIHNLDNSKSIGPNSLRALKMSERGRSANLNENHGRELLELHTVSPNAGKVATGFVASYDKETKVMKYFRDRSLHFNKTSYDHTDYTGISTTGRIYQFESSIARKWRKGRIFIAGDAAHLMPPFMGQGMCAGIRDASNLAWKIATCLRVKHNDTFLNTYQTERSLNVKEYIETTMRMGEFVNAVESIQITDNIRSDNKGIKSMKSIRPKMGKGLGNLKDKNRGKIFPQFKLNKNRSLDDNFSKKGILILSSDIKTKVSKNYALVNSKKFKKLSVYLKNINTKAVIVRPDRFILGSANSNHEINLLLKKYSAILR